MISSTFCVKVIKECQYHPNFNFSCFLQGTQWIVYSGLHVSDCGFVDKTRRPTAEKYQKLNYYEQ